MLDKKVAEGIREMMANRLAPMPTPDEGLRAALEVHARIDAACLKVCRDNTPEAIGEPDSEYGRYVCMNENGDPIINTNDPVGVIVELDRLWGRVSEKNEELRAQLAAVTRERDELEERIAQLGQEVADARRSVDGWRTSAYKAGADFAAEVARRERAEKIAAEYEKTHTPPADEQRRVVAEWLRGGTVNGQHLLPSLWECAQRGELTFAALATDTGGSDAG